MRLDCVLFIFESLGMNRFFVSFQGWLPARIFEWQIYAVVQCSSAWKYLLAEASCCFSFLFASWKRSAAGCQWLLDCFQMNIVQKSFLFELSRAIAFATCVLSISVQVSFGFCQISNNGYLLPVLSRNQFLVVFCTMARSSYQCSLSTQFFVGAPIGGHFKQSTPLFP